MPHMALWLIVSQEFASSTFEQSVLAVAWSKATAPLDSEYLFEQVLLLVLNNQYVQVALESGNRQLSWL